MKLFVKNVGGRVNKKTHMEIIPIADFTWDPQVYALPGEVNKIVILETKIHLHPLSIQTK